MNRRSFVKAGLMSGAALNLPHGLNAKNLVSAGEEPFNIKFSPEFGIFADIAGSDPIDQIKWGFDQGFRAWENTFLKYRPIAEQEKISSIIQKLGMEFGQFVGTLTFEDVTFAGQDKNLRDKVLTDIKASVEIAKRMNTKIVHNVLGVADKKLPMGFQIGNAIELLKRIADIYEPHGIVMVMESMNSKVDHPGMFLSTIPQAYTLAKAVDSPNVKILFDFYHVQIEEGNVLSTLDYAWDEIAYIQVGDTPGRNEPTTGEINFPNVMQHVYNKGYRGFVGMEHKSSIAGKEGDLAILKSYRVIDVKK